MNTKALNSLADIICRAQENGKRTPMGIAFAIDSAQRHMTPETAAELEQLRASLREACDQIASLESELGGAAARVAELERQLAAKDRPVDEDPIAYALTDKATDSVPAPQRDASPRQERLRDLLAVQRAMVLEDQHDSPLHHDYRVPRDLPEVQL